MWWDFSVVSWISSQHKGRFLYATKDSIFNLMFAYRAEFHIQHNNTGLLHEHSLPAHIIFYPSKQIHLLERKREQQELTINVT